MLEKLMNNPYAWLFLSALSIFSVIFGIWTWCAGKQRKEISIECKSDVLIKAGKQQIKSLEILYNGKQIADLSSTKFYIWNSGNQVINREDIVTARPISISADSTVNILDAQILKVSDMTNKFTICERNENYVRFDFEYVEQGTGILVQLLHTGDPLNLKFDCKIKGGFEVRDRSIMHKDRKISKTDRFLDFIGSEFAFFTWVFFTGLGFFIGTNIFIVPETNEFTSGGILGSMAVIIACFSIGLSLSKRIRKFANNLFYRSIPENLLSLAKKE